MKLYDALSLILESDNSVTRVDIFDHIKTINYANSELSDHQLWLISESLNDNAKITEMLNNLSESGEELSLDLDAPEEPESLDIDLDAEEESESNELDDATISDDDNLELPSEIETPMDSDDSQESNENTAIDAEQETSAEGIGVLSLIGEIQSKLANGKPSEVEIAAIKALSKLLK